MCHYFQAEVIVKHDIHTGCGDHPVPYPTGTGVSFHRGKRPEREADHAPPFSVGVDSDAIPLLPLRDFMACRESTLTLSQ